MAETPAQGRITSWTGGERAMMTTKAPAGEETRRRCEWCGKFFGRRQSDSGGQESAARFARRKFCSRQCAARAGNAARRRQMAETRERRVPEHLRPALAAFVLMVR